MRLRQHIEIGKSEIAKITDNRILRLAYLFGVVTPDLIEVYPSHVLDIADNKFYKHVYRAARTHFRFIRYYELGMATHYIMDYFTVSHNNYAPRNERRTYNNNLLRHYENHEYSIGISSKRLAKIWDKNNTKTILQVKEMKHVENTSKLGVYLLEQLKAMHLSYRRESNINKSTGWQKNRKQYHIDSEYAVYMTRKVLQAMLLRKRADRKN